MTTPTDHRRAYERAVQTCDGAWANLCEVQVFAFYKDDCLMAAYLRALHFFRSSYGNKLVEHNNWRNAAKEAEMVV